MMQKIFSFVFKSPEDMGVFRRMVAENFSLYKRDYIIACFCLLVIAGTTAFSGWIMAPIVSDVFLNGDFDRAIGLSIVVAVVFIIKGIVSYFQSVILMGIGNNIIARYQRRVFEHLLALDVNFFTKQHSAALVSRLNQNIQSISNMLNTIVLSYVRDLVTLIGLVGVMVYRDPYMAAIILSVGPLVLWTLSRYARRVKTIARQQVLINAQVATAMQEASQGITVIKAFTMEQQLSQKLMSMTEEVEGRSNKIARITARTSPLMETLAGLTVALVIIYGGWRVINHGYDAGDLTSFMASLLLAFDPAKKLARMRVALERTMVNGRMVYEVLDTPIPERSNKELVPFDIKGGEIEFNAVTFRYDEGGASDVSDAAKAVLKTPPVIQELSFVAQAGKTTALVGPSGGGKSTIVALIQRFYEVESGLITIDGQDISKLESHELRSHIAYVSQSPMLFQGTVLENLRYARPEASDEEIKEAAKNAQAHDFITALPEGYDTPLGENGTNLSGGQRQRLSIARAIVRNASILLLDEATSALDNRSEALVQKALDELMKGRTTLVIAHRLTTIADADSIVVIDGGKVVDQGRHEDLIKRKRGVYARLHDVNGHTN